MEKLSFSDVNLRGSRIRVRGRWGVRSRTREWRLDWTYWWVRLSDLSCVERRVEKFLAWKLFIVCRRVLVILLKWSNCWRARVFRSRRVLEIRILSRVRDLVVESFREGGSWGSSWKGKSSWRVDAEGWGVSACVGPTRESCKRLRLRCSEPIYYIQYQNQNQY